MKKILSVLLVAAMLISALCAIAVVPASAAEGMWDTFAGAADYLDINADSRLSIPGYEYTDDGLHVIPGDWSTTTVFGTVSSKNTIDLKDGVYMEVVVDDFTLANDRWLMFHIWSEQTIVPASNSEDYGYGVKVFGRPGNPDKETGESSFKGVSWYYEYFSSASGDPIPEDQIPTAKVETAEDGTQTYVEKYVLKFTVTYDGTSYNAFYNGAPAPEAVVKYLNETFGGNSQAYIGFSFYNTTKGGNAEFTITKFGTDEETATVPMGDDDKAPENYKIEYADIMDPSAVPAGQPAILMNADTTSDIGGLPDTSTGSKISINGDFIRVVGTKTTTDAGSWKVKSTVSYDVADFPVMMCVVKGLCTCGEDECYALENATFYPFVGDVLAADDSHVIRQVDGAYDPYVIEEGEHAGNYLYFYADLSDPYTVSWEPTGRINGVRVDVTGLDVETAGKSTFDVCWVGCFRNVDEAETYVEKYMTTLGWVDPYATEDEETTEAPEVTTEAPEVTTEAPEVNTEAPVGGDDEEPKSGCGSVVGFGAIALVAVAGACGVVAFRKKED